ncbi:MAG: metal-sensitive transcriptional regulator [Vulcanimicrobiaceae bacterium]
MGTSRPAADRPLDVSDEVVADVTVRLRRVEGQIRAVQRLIEERRDCRTIVQQLAAAKAALERATIHLMTHSLASCIRNDRSGADGADVARLTDLFVKML